jgi:acyl dehydratase
VPIDYATLKNFTIPERVHSYGTRDSILYALGLGLGSDPVNVRELRFVYEKDLQVLPTMLAILGHPGSWLRDSRTGVNYTRVLHAEQGIVLARPIPAEGTVIGRSRVDEVVDRGVGKGAFIYVSREVIDAASGTTIGTLSQTIACLADGGFGGPSGPARPVASVPSRAPDLQIDWPTLPQAALLYRLSGDFNPLHADPDVAKSAGFARPILHGLCTFGIAGYILLRELAQSNAERFKAMRARFSAPVFPGETIRTEIWRGEGHTASFRCSIPDRSVVVVSSGYFELTS